MWTGFKDSKVFVGGVLIYVFTRIASWGPPHPSSGLLGDGWFRFIREWGALGSRKGQCTSLTAITRSVEAPGGQRYSFHKFMGCGLFFFSCWKCVFVWLLQSCLPWILNCCPSRVLRPWPTCVNGQGHSGRGLRSLPQRGGASTAKGTSGHCRCGWCLLGRWQHPRICKNELGCFDYMKFYTLQNFLNWFLLKKISMRNFLMMEVTMNETVF